MKTKNYLYSALFLGWIATSGCLSSFGPGGAYRSNAPLSVPRPEAIGRAEHSLSADLGPGVTYHGEDNNFNGSIGFSTVYVPDWRSDRRYEQNLPIPVGLVLGLQTRLVFGSYSINHPCFEEISGNHGYGGIGFGGTVGLVANLHERWQLLAVGTLYNYFEGGEYPRLSLGQFCDYQTNTPSISSDSGARYFRINGLAAQISLKWTLGSGRYLTLSYREQSLGENSLLTGVDRGFNLETGTRNGRYSIYAGLSRNLSLRGSNPAPFLYGNMGVRFRLNAPLGR